MCYIYRLQVFIYLQGTINPGRRYKSLKWMVCIQQYNEWDHGVGGEDKDASGERAVPKTGRESEWRMTKEDNAEGKTCGFRATAGRKVGEYEAVCPAPLALTPHSTPHTLSQK